MNFLAWPLTIGVLCGMYPYARLLLRGDTNPLLTALITLALSFGALSLIAMWIGLFGLSIDWRLITAIYAGIVLIGFLILSRTGNPADSRTKVDTALLPRTWRGMGWAITIVIGIVAALIMFNAIYWPLGIDDALAIYGFYGKQIALSGHLPPLSPGALYEAYPMAVPLWYAYTHQAAGWIDEHLAAVIPALLSVGVIGVAYLIGCELYDKATGLIAALLIALTPTIAFWSSASYVDLPAGFSFGLAILFALRNYRRRAVSDALLCGIMAGLSAWTKNSGLLLVGTLSLWVIYCAWRARFELPRPLSRRDVLLIAAGFLAVCAPWYIRDWLLTGEIIPPTGWTFAAQRTTANFLPYLFDLEYWPTGWLFTGGFFLTLWQAWRTRGRGVASAALLIGYVPFFVIWWALFSYEDRFLLLLTPLIAVMGARLVVAIGERLKLPRPVLLRQPTRLTLALLGVIVLFALPSVSEAVQFKFDILRHPLMSEADKQRLRLGGRYDLALYLQSLPTGSRTLTDDLLLPYLALPAQVTTGNPPDSEADFPQQFAYLALKPGDSVPAWASTVQPIFESGGYRLYSAPATSKAKFGH